MLCCVVTLCCIACWCNVVYSCCYMLYVVLFVGDSSCVDVELYVGAVLLVGDLSCSVLVLCCVLVICCVLWWCCVVFCVGAVLYW